MILDALFLAFTLGSEKSKEQTAAMEAKRIMRDETDQRNKFFADQRKWQEDKFTLFGAVGSSSGYDFQWREAFEKLALLDDGFWPYAMTFKYPISIEDLQRSKLDGFQYKVIQNGDYAELYLKLSDVEKYIVYRNSTGHYYKCSLYEEICPEVRELFYNGKVTIGIPFGQSGTVPCQSMTIQEAKEFVQTVMENRFQQHWKK